MKKILFYLPLAICAAIVAFSCEKVIEQQEEINNQEAITTANLKTQTFSLVFDPETKITIDGDGKTGWKIGDEILIHGEYINKSGYSVVVTLDGSTNTISADNKTAYITLTTTEEGDALVDGTVQKYSRKAKNDYTSSLYAAYPASAVTSELNHHSYYNTMFETTNEPLMLAYDDGAGNFVFRNLCSMITFIMPDIDGNPSTNDFDYYIFSGNKGEAVDYGTYAAVFAKYKTGSIKNRQGGTYDSSVTAGADTEVSGAVVCDGSTLNKIFIPGLSNGDEPSEGIRFEEGFTIEFVKDGDVTYRVKTKSDITLAVGDYLALGDISSHLKSYSRPAHVSSLSSSTDLSVTLGGKANCYYVAADVAANEGATFKFPQYKGKSSESLGRVYSVELVWETLNTDTAPSVNGIIKAIDYDDTYIYFKMPDTIVPGNALIAAKNVLGEILWSWHIWVPETSISDKSGIYTTDMMDRNLGALVATSTGAARTTRSYGMLYQWGRKDPFVGAKSTSSGSFASVTGRKMYSAGTQLTLAQSIMNPTLMGTGGGGQDWISTSDNNLWKDSEKTMYDPCPPTYRVPKKDDSAAIHKVLSAQTGWENNTTYMYFTLGSPVHVFPYTGYLDDWGSLGSINYNSSSQRANLWTSSWHYNNVGYGVDVRSDGSKCQINDFGKTRGCAIRCVKE